jgi:hypothetical protein
MAIRLPKSTKITRRMKRMSRKEVPGMKYISRRRSPVRFTSSIKCLKQESTIDGIMLAPKRIIRHDRVRWRSLTPYLPQKDSREGDDHGGVNKYFVQMPAAYEEHAGEPQGKHGECEPPIDHLPVVDFLSERVA